MHLPSSLSVALMPLVAMRLQSSMMHYVSFVSGHAELVAALTLLGAGDLAGSDSGRLHTAYCPGGPHAPPTSLCLSVCASASLWAPLFEQAAAVGVLQVSAADQSHDQESGEAGPWETPVDAECPY